MADLDTEFVWRKVRLGLPARKSSSSEPPSVYLRPLGILWGDLARVTVAEGLAWPFLGNGAYTSCQVVLRVNQCYQMSYMTAASFGLWRDHQSGNLLDEIEGLFETLSSFRKDQFGFEDRTPRIVGILNITPDSFSDGGENMQLQHAVRRALEMIKNGTITEGMIPKINTCLDAINNNVTAVAIIDGRKKHSVLFEIFSDKGSGTLIRK